ncbi:cytochrome c biogenesis protein ResB [Azohydromonas lata]|uniref:Cytochrome c biogenesis protein ResB n=1 Tax=Azohydromonas lata TaxID=45677 RepID=A0ABU5IFN5_9BURK|nr:cytochrome c biogenesis protein ResB [Azohydromonas lata]MDZ5457792.1 cytochrome c biogenesis protein ResB [Azohydromonas lata]
MTVSAPAARAPQQRLRDTLELVSSMRFAIALLTVICIASVIGTVVKQHEPLNNYVNQFGPFWAEVFGAVGLYSVYSAWWFLLILGFLVLSTSLCIARNTPRFLADMRSYKENIRESALKAFHHKAQGVLPDEAPQASLQRVSQLLTGNGWKAKVQQREGGTLIAARKGAANKLGYIAAHSAIVLICLGGLFDGDLIVRAQMLLLGKTPFNGGGLIRDVAPEHRLSPANPTFRGNLLVPEGVSAGTAVLNMSDGVVLQDLPFDVELKKFIVEYYDTGMPKLFASEIVIHDHESGQATPATVKVNEPAFHRGIAIYQSSFDDGGSKLKLQAVPMKPGAKAFTINGTVGDNSPLDKVNLPYTLELTGLRVINVENMGAASTDSGADVRKVDLADSLQKHLGSGAKSQTEKQLHNIGPSFSYKLRDASGQAREFNNYQLPVELDGQRVLLAGMRDNPNEAFRYLRIPVDEQDRMDTWRRMREALLDPAAREQAARRYAKAASPADKPEVMQQLQVTAQRVLGLFAGADKPPALAPAAGAASGAAGAAAAEADPPPGGLAAMARFMETTVPEGDRARVSEVLLRILNGSLFELANIAREQAGQPAMTNSEKTQAFMTQAVVSLSDSFYYPVPVLLQLDDFQQIQASVFQIARAPGKKLVYLGAVLLILGVFAMLYVRERRLWVWVQAQDQGSRITTALSTTRRTMDADAEFELLKKAILKDAAA